MCLATITDREPKPEETGIGYKVVRKVAEGSFRSPFYSTYYKSNEWVKANSLIFPGPQYPSGFHIFSTKEDAETYLKEFIPATFAKTKVNIVVRVKYKGVLCRGTTFVPNDIQCMDWYLPTLVVEQILVDEGEK